LLNGLVIFSPSLLHGDNICYVVIGEDHFHILPDILAHVIGERSRVGILAKLAPFTFALIL